MRDIKFRAWSHGVKADTPANRRQYGEWIFPPQMLYDEKPGDCLVWKLQGQNIEVMQYTGLHDENGNEIYESDIIEIGSDSPPYHDVVEFGGGMFRTAEEHEAISNITDEQFGDGCRVVGNIHQHEYDLYGVRLKGTR